MSILYYLGKYQTAIELGVALGTLAAAYFAGRSAFQTKQGVKAAFYQRILDQRYSDEMLSSRRMLHDWKRRNEDRHKEFDNEYIKKRATKAGSRLDSSRRYIKSYFEQVFLLRSANLISDRDVEHFVDCGELASFYETVRPLELALQKHLRKLDNIPKAESKQDFDSRFVAFYSSRYPRICKTAIRDRQLRKDLPAETESKYGLE
jgi:hypothetical protein